MAVLSVDGLKGVDLSAFDHVQVSSYFLQRGLQVGLASMLADASRAGATTSLDRGWDPTEDRDNSLVTVLGRLDWFLPNEVAAVAIAVRSPHASSPGPGQRDPVDPTATPHRTTLSALRGLGCGVVLKLGGARPWRATTIRSSMCRPHPSNRLTQQVRATALTPVPSPALSEAKSPSKPWLCLAADAWRSAALAAQGASLPPPKQPLWLTSWSTLRAVAHLRELAALDR